MADETRTIQMLRAALKKKNLQGIADVVEREGVQLRELALSSREEIGELLAELLDADYAIERADIAPFIDAVIAPTVRRAIDFQAMLKRTLDDAQLAYISELLATQLQPPLTLSDLIRLSREELWQALREVSITIGDRIKFANAVSRIVARKLLAAERAANTQVDALGRWMQSNKLTRLAPLLQDTLAFDALLTLREDDMQAILEECSSLALSPMLKKRFKDAVRRLQFEFTKALPRDRYRDPETHGRGESLMVGRVHRIVISSAQQQAMSSLRTLLARVVAKRCESKARRVGVVSDLMQMDRDIAAAFDTYANALKERCSALRAELAGERRAQVDALSAAQSKLREYRDAIQEARDQALAMLVDPHMDSKEREGKMEEITSATLQGIRAEHLILPLVDIAFQSESKADNEYIASMGTVSGRSDAPTVSLSDVGMATAAVTMRCSYDTKTVRFVLEYRKSDGDDEKDATWSRVEFDEGADKYTLAGCLDEDTEYELVGRYRNLETQIVSKPSQRVPLKTGRRPLPPTSLSVSDIKPFSARLSMQCVLNTNGVQYQIQYRKQTDDEKDAAAVWAEVDVQKNSEAHTLSLDENTDYLVAVRVNELKTLFFSDCTQAVALKTPLNPPKLKLYSRPGSSERQTSVVISMQSKLPTSSLRFELKYRKQADDEKEASWTVLDIGDNVDRYTLNALSEDTAYVAVGRLQHIESGVWSVFCDNFDFKTYRQPAPPKLTRSDTHMTSCMIRLQSNESKTKHYQLKYKKRNSSWKDLQLQEKNWHELNALEPNTAYVVAARVQITETGIWSELSEQDSFTTLYRPRFEWDSTNLHSEWTLKDNNRTAEKKETEWRSVISKNKLSASTMKAVHWELTTHACGFWTMMGYTSNRDASRQRLDTHLCQGSDEVSLFVRNGHDGFKKYTSGKETDIGNLAHTGSFQRGDRLELKFDFQSRECVAYFNGQKIGQLSSWFPSEIYPILSLSSAGTSAHETTKFNIFKK